MTVSIRVDRTHSIIKLLAVCRGLIGRAQASYAGTRSSILSRVKPMTYKTNVRF